MPRQKRHDHGIAYRRTYFLVDTLDAMRLLVVSMRAPTGYDVNISLLFNGSFFARIDAVKMLLYQFLFSMPTPSPVTDKAHSRFDKFPRQHDKTVMPRQMRVLMTPLIKPLATYA